MIESIQIKNFKSVVDLNLELGSFNVLIGENGCGKSNILEAIAFGAAANADKLDHEFLGSRGIRLTNPEFMVSAFKKNKSKKAIEIEFRTESYDYDYQIVNDLNNQKKWINKNKDLANSEMKNFFKKFFINIDENSKKDFLGVSESELHSLNLVSEAIQPYHADPEFKKFVSQMFPEIMKNISSNSKISDFIIYSPEQSSLRKFDETTQIYPLGVKGEGVFQYLKEIAFENKNKKILDQIKSNLQLLDWYENFELPENLLSNEYALKIKDKYINSTLNLFDQRSTNEGFLYLLFYSTLFISKSTPSFFAIDNVDASFNPKLCMELTKNLAFLAKKHKKQTIVTTQNPAILDGLNLKDENQRLFVVSRNVEGHTRVERINYNENRSMRLSEIWTKGFIGGLPENF
ncbi:MAG: AAA family ATPase [Crocinitomix sp.]|nr:AAA family ATPase [Crocinitomix sp.]